MTTHQANPQMIRFICMAMQEKIKKYGQNIFLESQATNGSAGNKEKTRDGIVKSMKDYNLDALVTPGLGASDVSITTVLAIGGFPGISVPAGYDSKGVPIGICFGGLKGSEPS